MFDEICVKDLSHFKFLKLSLTKPRAVSHFEIPVLTNRQTHITVKTLPETQVACLHRIMAIF